MVWCTPDDKALSCGVFPPPPLHPHLRVPLVMGLSPPLGTAFLDSHQGHAITPNQYSLSFNHHRVDLNSHLLNHQG